MVVSVRLEKSRGHVILDQAPENSEEGSVDRKKKEGLDWY